MTKEYSQEETKYREELIADIQKSLDILTDSDEEDE
jgi:hypothetical protein